MMNLPFFYLKFSLILGLTVCAPKEAASKPLSPPPVLPPLPSIDKEAILQGKINSLVSQHLAQDAKNLEAMKKRLELLKNIGTKGRLERIKETHQLKQIIEELEQTTSKLSEPSTTEPTCLPCDIKLEGASRRITSHPLNP